jgi:hypothetical protein
MGKGFQGALRACASALACAAVLGATGLTGATAAHAQQASGRRDALLALAAGDTDEVTRRARLFRDALERARP